ncbi:hypothetical protein GEMRC1_003434 [Eukaryota sp. GEM-RC1]
MTHTIVVIGSGSVGKSSLTLQLVQGQFFEVYDPTVVESFRAELLVNGRRVPLEIIDTAGQDDFSSLRDGFISQGDGFLLVYSIDCPASFEEAKLLYQQVLDAKGTETVPIVIVANKCDLQQNRKVSKEDGEAFAKRCQAPFFESSAKNFTNVKEAFVEAVKQIQSSQSKGCCSLM